MDEEAHIKDALSRILVEMIKREWPQHWPQLLTELAQLSKMGVGYVHTIPIQEHNP